MKIEVSKIKEAVAQVAEKHPIKFVVLFGSLAKGSRKEASDFDIAVYLEDNIPFFSSEAYFEFLSVLSETLRAKEDKIDLTDLKRANILLRYEITSTGVLLYGDREEYESFRLFAFKDYVDSKSLRELEGVLVKKRQEKLAAALQV